MEILEILVPILPTALWFLLALILILVFRGTINDLASLLLWRVKTGSGIKIADFELSAAYVAPDSGISSSNEIVETAKDEGRARYKERSKYYLPNRDVFLVHRVTPSSKPRQLYDVLVYLIPHKDATLVNVRKVVYYFGPHWGEHTFTSTNRASGFAISTSAFGPFVCTAELHFTDGETTILARYIDFEMGQIGKRA